MIRLFPPEERSDKPGNHAARKRDHHHPQGGKKLFPGGRFVKGVQYHHGHGHIHQQPDQHPPVVLPDDIQSADDKPAQHVQKQQQLGIDHSGDNVCHRASFLKESSFRPFLPASRFPSPVAAGGSRHFGRDRSFSFYASQGVVRVSA